jgi:hypothetical protein
MNTSRRSFIKTVAGAATAVAGLEGSLLAAEKVIKPIGGKRNLPWYRRTLRWGQTNITEHDPAEYDITWWRAHWKRTQVQGVIINAGGIVAYYPSKFPLHRRAEILGDRDLFGELCRAANEDGLVVFARMDSNRAHEDFYRAHPGWFAVDAAGKPFRAGDQFITCINSPYYDDYIPDILREIIERYRPEGFTDNSWSGLGRASICHCENCARKFRERTPQPLPREKNWDDPVYREWIQWNYARRVEVWDSNNRVTRGAGGPDCLWAGMNSGSVSGQCQSFRDYKEICARAEIIMLDHQARGDGSGFQHNGETGKLIHGLLGWDKLIPESMAMYQAGKPTFRLSAKPAAEARLWMLDGFAGGLQPWWHHVGAYHEDRRAYHTAEPLMRWHHANEEFLVNRRPVATVGVVWSQTNYDFYGRDDPENLVELPWRGWTNALVRARVPYLPVHADHIERDAAKYAILILPNFAAMTDAQVASVRRFVQSGGSLIATGEASRCNEWGEPHTDFALADLFGAHAPESRAASVDARKRRWFADTAHTYLRLAPESRARVYGPKAGEAASVVGQRHPLLRGFDETDILPFGGMLEAMRVDPDAAVLARFVPPFPIYPPETAWMREPRTTIPGLLARTLPGGARVAFFSADLDRRFARDNLPDHGDLLANAVRWAARDHLPFVVEGAGLIDCHLYRQDHRLIVHLVNLTNAGTWRPPVHELIPVGPLHITMQVPDGISAKRARLLVSSGKPRLRVAGSVAVAEIASLLDHELLVIG